jgi:hypothetical protein
VTHGGETLFVFGLQEKKEGAREAWWRRQVRWEDKEEEVTQGGMVATVEDHRFTHTSCPCRSPC